MPERLLEALIPLLGVLFFFIIPLVLRFRSAARRRQAEGPRPVPPAGEKAREEEPSAARSRAPWPPAQELREAMVERASPVPAGPLPGAEPAPTPPFVAAAMPAVAHEPRFQPAAATPYRRPRLPRLGRLTPLQRAVVWAEILGPPRGLDGQPSPGSPR